MIQLGDSNTAANTSATVQIFLMTNPTPSSGQIADFLKTFVPDDRAGAAQALAAAGVNQTDISSAMQFLSSTGFFTVTRIWEILAIASAAASGYHGYRRNQSIGWGVAWFALGSLFPVVTPTIAAAQGFAKRKAG